MNTAPDRNVARRKQLALSLVVTTLIAALAAAVTFAMALRDDLSLAARVAISAVIWTWVPWAAWEFRKIYVRMGVASEKPRIDT
jgi:hypothetical protein